MTTLENIILKFINEDSGCEYKGKIKVLQNDSNYYTLLLYLNLELSPMALGFEGTEEEFLEFVKDEIHKRQLHTIGRFGGYQTTPVFTDWNELNNYDDMIIPY